MTRTAFLHIGAPKTGTTAIQAALADARPALSDAGFHYLAGDRNHSERLALAFWQADDAARLARLRHVEEESFDQAALCDELAWEIEEAGESDVILSAEGVSEFHPSEARALIRFLDRHVDRVRLVAYVREPLSWMTSAAQQAVKLSGQTLDELFRVPRLPEYARRFDPILAVVPPENCDLRVFGGPGFDAVTDFARAVGLPRKLTGQLSKDRQNPALTKEAAIALSAVNRATPPFVEYVHNPCRAFGVVEACRLPGQRLALPREVVQVAKEQLQEERHWIGRHFGREVFSPAVDAGEPLETWFGPDRNAVERMGVQIADLARKAQNEKALQAFIRVGKQRSNAPEVADTMLSTAGLLATDRWTMAQIAEAAVASGHEDRNRFFAKQRLMRRSWNPLRVTSRLPWETHSIGSGSPSRSCRDRGAGWSRASIKQP